jgi:16S rRNA (cytosine967-C5)-methyltransferase
MNYSFRDYHLLALCHHYEQQPAEATLPADVCISKYFKAHKALGPKDRGEIAETFYALIRWQGMLDFLAGETPVTWEKRLELYRTVRLTDSLNDTAIPLHIRYSFPKELFDLIGKSHGETYGCELCRISNQAAPTTIRVNRIKISREELFARWRDKYDISPCQRAPDGIIFHKKIHFFGLTEFREGLFEIQDEGSQLASALVGATPGQQVLDFCAGSGGKTLAFGPHMQGKGQIFLHDIRPRALAEAKIRLRRSGMQNVQILQAEDKKQQGLKKRMDWVLVDAPCSGTGTMRRNPDMKWKFTGEMLKRLVGQQRTIFEKALSFVKPGGHIVYVTCSILQEENEEQVAHFLKTYPLSTVGTPFISHPSNGGMDGFFGTVFKM